MSPSLLLAAVVQVAAGAVPAILVSDGIASAVAKGTSTRTQLDFVGEGPASPPKALAAFRQRCKGTTEESFKPPKK